jgi:hypothetical protein
MHKASNLMKLKENANAHHRLTMYMLVGCKIKYAVLAMKFLVVAMPVFNKTQNRRVQNDT